jgi:mRNA-degrading endonuclease YafQ of YafQ-DinJ toxin-antitoxin module
MISVSYARRFLRDLNKLEPALQEEVIEKIELFRDTRNHTQLRIHKLHGELKGRLSFSVNYRSRIIFEYVGKGKNSVVLITAGDHDIYQ